MPSYAKFAGALHPSSAGPPPFGRTCVGGWRGATRDFRRMAEAEIRRSRQYPANRNFIVVANHRSSRFQPGLTRAQAIGDDPARARGQALFLNTPSERVASSLAANFTSLDAVLNYREPRSTT